MKLSDFFRISKLTFFLCILIYRPKLTSKLRTIKDEFPRKIWREWSRKLNNMLNQIRRFVKPWIARINWNNIFIL